MNYLLEVKQGEFNFVFSHDISHTLYLIKVFVLVTAVEMQTHVRTNFQFTTCLKTQSQFNTQTNRSRNKFPKPSAQAHAHACKPAFPKGERHWLDLESLNQSSIFQFGTNVPKNRTSPTSCLAEVPSVVCLQFCRISARMKPSRRTAGAIALSSSRKPDTAE